MAKIKIKQYNYSNKFKKKIMLFSDIHYYSKKDQPILDRLLKIVKERKPDYICITGDLIEVNPINDEEILLDFLYQLRKQTLVLIVLGNHDLRTFKAKYLFDNLLFKKIKQTGCIILNNNCYKVDGINFLTIFKTTGYCINSYSIGFKQRRFT